MAEVTDNPNESRYETTVDGVTAFVTYRLAGNHLVLIHTEVPAELGGQGIGSALARAALEDIRRRGMKVVAECEFMAAFIARNPAYQDLVAA